MISLRDVAPINWWDAEPARFARDQDEVAARFPRLTWTKSGAGSWEGRLPMWPFERPEPPGLSRILGDVGMEVIIVYRQAYPIVPPRLYPVDPRPEPVERTQHRWHVNGDGSLCQFQSETVWDPRDSICDLILKAAGWRVEYALMKAGALEQMTLHGIVDDSSLDNLVTAASESLEDQSRFVPAHEDAGITE